MQFLLPDEARERWSGYKSLSAARKKIIIEESMTYSRMIPAFQKASTTSCKATRIAACNSLKTRYSTPEALSATDQSRPH
jgi:hypothetical protein